MDKVIQKDHANNDKEKDSKLNENERSPGKSFSLGSCGGISRIRIEVSFLFSCPFFDIQFCQSFCLLA